MAGNADENEDNGHEVAPTKHANCLDYTSVVFKLFNVKHASGSIIALYYILLNSFTSMYDSLTCAKNSYETCVMFSNKYVVVADIVLVY